MELYLQKPGSEKANRFLEIDNHPPSAMEVTVWPGSRLGPTTFLWLDWPHACLISVSHSSVLSSFFLS